MTNNIIVSTISPSYKMEKYLGKFLEQLPKQTIFDNLEVVLDHNEPTGKEMEMVRKFQKKYPGKIKHIIKKKVVPIGVSMNDCIKNATGKYLAIWNLDDLRTPNSLESQLNEMKKSSSDIVFGNYLNVGSFGTKTGSLVSVMPARKDYLRGMYLGPFFMFRRNLLKKSGLFDEQLKSGADFDLAIRLAINGKVSKTNKLLGYYLNAGTGASTRPGSLQSVERTVIELRYAAYDKVDSSLIAKATQYVIPNILVSSNWQDVGQYFPNYQKYISSREKEISLPITNSIYALFKSKLTKLFHI